jgi:hypothetical protein
MGRQRFTDALDHPVVKDVGPLIKRPLRGKDHQAIEQQTPGGHAVHHPQLARALQHLCARFFAGIRFPASTRETVLMDSCVRAAISVIFSLLSIL